MFVPIVACTDWRDEMDRAHRSMDHTRAPRREPEHRGSWSSPFRKKSSHKRDSGAMCVKTVMVGMLVMRGGGGDTASERRNQHDDVHVVS